MLSSLNLPPGNLFHEVGARRHSDVMQAIAQNTEAKKLHAMEIIRAES
jgi:hypothetical protein